MIDKPDNTDDRHEIVDLHTISAATFAALGNGEIAYVKPVVVEGAGACAVHAADGRPLAVVPDRDLAFAVIRQNDMEPMSVH
jgi:hypothetical protein